MVMEILKGLILGIIQGVVIAALGYAKSAGEEFDEAKFFQTIIIGAIVGGLAAYFGMAYDKMEDYLITSGGITIIEYLKKAVWRRFLSVAVKKE